MKIQVTQEDISKGIRASSGNCPVANAISRTNNANMYIAVGWFNCFNFKDRKSCFHSLSTFVRILLFDFFGKMRPFTFELPADWIQTTSDVHTYKLNLREQHYIHNAFIRGTHNEHRNLQRQTMQT